MWGMLGNDQYGDCGPAATEHYRMAKAGTADITNASDAATEALYFAYGRAQGEPGSHPDQGVDNASWLKWMFDNGYITAYARVDANDADAVRMAMLNFSGVLVGCSLADQAEQEFNDHRPWTITAAERPDPQEGHDILLVAYDSAGETFVTWGALQRATVAWESGEAHAGDLEAWVIMTNEDAARNGVDLDALRAQISAWGGESVAPPTPAPAPAPSPAPQPEPSPSPEPTPSEWKKFAHDLRVAIRNVDHVISEFLKSHA